MKVNAVLWYLSGMSMHRIAFLLRVSAQAVLTWIRDGAKDAYEKPEPTGRTIVLQRDEMWYYLRKKRCKLWIWKALDRDTGQLLDWEGGRRDKATLQKMVDRLATWDVQRYCTDTWATSASGIPQDKLVQRKATTHEIERHHCRQRHWFGRFKRKSIIVSSPKRWSISPWHCSRSFGSMGTKMNSYHYLLETLEDFIHCEEKSVIGERGFGHCAAVRVI
jgi:IS1 family transposase